MQITMSNEGGDSSGPSNFRWRRIFGDFPIGREFLQQKSDASPWIALKVADSVLRGVAQVCFADHPIAGLVVTIGVGLAGWELALGCVLGPFIALLAAFSLGQSRDLVYNGIFLFNACLVGSVVPSLYPAVYGGERNLQMWIFVILASALTIPVQVGVTRIISPITADFPGEKGGDIKSAKGLTCLTFPFNLMANVAMICLVATHDVSSAASGTEEAQAANSTMDESIDWYKVGEGIILSGGEVYGVHTFAGSIVVYLGLAIYSPLLSFVSLFGAAIGTLGGLYFTVLPRSAVYAGIWGFSPFLTAGAMAKTFYVPGVRSWILTVAAILLTVGMQAMLTQTFPKVGLGVYTLPFVLTTWLFMLITSEGGDIRRT